MEAPVFNTEERILEAAKKVFLRKGYDGARMQEIADEAGVNKSLVHYYYRNKDTIFQSVFENAFVGLMAKVNEIFLSELSLTSKIETFLNYYISFLSQNSYLPLFILNGLYKKPEQIIKMIEKNQVSTDHLMEKMATQVKEELNIDIDPFHLFINILSISIFPVVGRPLIQTIFGISNEQFDQFYDDRKKVVPEFILNALKGYEIQKYHV